MKPRVALATCAELPEGDDDAPALIEALAALAVDASSAVWDSPAVDWPRFDLVVVRSAWDYAERCDAFLHWADSLPRVLNPPAVLRWSTDKETYLGDLERAGVPVVPTTYAHPGERFDPPAYAFVVKPSVSAGGRASAWFDRGDAAAAELVGRIHGEGRTAIVQPFLGDVTETAAVFIDGEFSHALHRRVGLPAGVRGLSDKGAAAPAERKASAARTQGACVSGGYGRDRGRRRAPLGSRQEPGALFGQALKDVLYLEERLERGGATRDELEVARAAIATAPRPLLYGRVDLVDSRVLELELAEPSLYLEFGEGACERFASAIARRVTSS